MHSGYWCIVHLSAACQQCPRGTLVNPDQKLKKFGFVPANLFTSEPSPLNGPCPIAPPLCLFPSLLMQQKQTAPSR